MIRLCGLHGQSSLCPLPCQDGLESSSKSKLSPDEEDTTDENAVADKGEAENSSNGQVVSDGEEGQERPPSQDTLPGISQVFSMHEDTDPEEKIQSIWQKQQQPPRTVHPRNPVSHLRKSRSQMRHSAMRPGRKLDSWTHISMVGTVKRLLKVSQAGPPETP